MTIICLEGPSAAGKTTAATFMSEELGFERVPEVNELFERPTDACSTWYFQMQVKRWAMASDVSSSGGVAILDGDHLQPVWYNWIFNNAGLQPMDEVLAFYRQAFLTGELGFPDAYLVLTSDVAELRARKERDPSRSRRNFDTHLQLIEPQKTYFEALLAGRVCEIDFVSSTSPGDVADRCASLCQTARRCRPSADFDVVERFMAKQTAV